MELDFSFGVVAILGFRTRFIFIFIFFWGAPFFLGVHGPSGCSIRQVVRNQSYNPRKEVPKVEFALLSVGGPGGPFHLPWRIEYPHKGLFRPPLAPLILARSSLAPFARSSLARPSETLAEVDLTSVTTLHCQALAETLELPLPKVLEAMEASQLPVRRAVQSRNRSVERAPHGPHACWSRREMHSYRRGLRFEEE